MNNLLAAMNLPLGSIESYISRVNQFPMLTAEQEFQFAQDYQQRNEVEGARQLVLAHLRYVVRVAKGYIGYGLPLADLIQEGNVGLMKAVKRFDPNVGVRLVSFAVHWIKAEIHEFVIKNWRIVKVATTKAQRKLFFNLRNMKKRLGWFSDNDVAYVAETLQVSPEEVRLMEQRLNAVDAPYDGPDVEEDTAFLSPSRTIGDTACDPAVLVEHEQCEDVDKSQLAFALNQLDSRSQVILQRRWLEEKKATLHELADELGISAERVRQLEKNAMNKLRKHLEASV